LMPRSRAWTGGQDPSIHRRWHLAFHLEVGALRPPVVTLAEGRVLVGGGVISQAVPLLSNLCRSPPPVHDGSKLRMQAPVVGGPL
jgi:hypothetical protein